MYLLIRLQPDTVCLLKVTADTKTFPTRKVSDRKMNTASRLGHYMKLT